MGRVTKFIENELDRINEYLSMAKACLEVTSELCEDKCKKIVPVISIEDEQVLTYLSEELVLLDTKICDAKNIINKFKDYYFNLEN